MPPTSWTYLHPDHGLAEAGQRAPTAVCADIYTRWWPPATAPPAPLAPALPAIGPLATRIDAALGSLRDG